MGKNFEFDFTDIDLDSEELSWEDEDWEDFLSWARDNPEESDYPLRDNYVTNRAYERALKEWEDKARAAMLFNS